MRNLFVEVTSDDGTVGWGEHAPSKRVTGHGFEEAAASAAELAKNPGWADRLLEDAQHMPDELPALGARNALTGAWLDLEGQRRGVPAHKLLNLPEGRIASSVTITVSDPDSAVRSAVAYAEEGWGAFKVKLGGDHDEAVIERLRDQFPDVPIRADANEGWSLERAKHMMPVLQRNEVEFIEQPLKRDDWTGLKELNHEFELPVFLDESVLDTQGLLKAIRAGSGDGVVIKLAKCGGAVEARRMVKIARDHNWKIMVGCMIESTAGIAAASTLAGVVDYLDLDGNALIKDDPFESAAFEGRRVSTPVANGLGIRRRQGGAALKPLEPAEAAR